MALIKLRLLCMQIRFCLPPLHIQALIQDRLLPVLLLTVLFIIAGNAVLAADKNTEQLLPALVCSHDSYNVGHIASGAVIKHSFALKNVGKTVLTIAGAYVSCGCTVAKLRSKELPPGASTVVDVTMDTKLKFGQIDRPISVVSNDPVRRTLVLHLLADIFNPHQGLKPTDIKAKIFRGQCAVCHSEKGAGKSGSALYLADCAMCHGAPGEIGLASTLMPGNLMNMVAAKRTITNGSEFTPTMPPFLKSHGGPLSEAQVDSIIRYLKGTDHPHN